MSRYKMITCSIFIALELILYYFILFNDIIPTHISSYVSLLVCFIVAIMLYKDDLDWKIVLCALFFTLIADLFLVLLFGKHKEIAMVFFCVTQFLYAYRLKKLSNNAKANETILFTRAFFILLMEIVAIILLRNKMDALVFITIIYFVNLVINIVHCLILKEKTILFSIGLMLFLLCDITIGLNFLCVYFPIQETSFFYQMVHCSFNFAWLFYLPSQVCITLSLLKHKPIESSNA